MFAFRTSLTGVRLASALAVSALTALTLGSRNAAAQTVAFSGSGAVSGPAQVAPQLLGLTMSSASLAYTFAGASGWGVDKVFSFNVATLTGGGSFTFSKGSDSLTGSFVEGVWEAVITQRDCTSNAGTATFLSTLAFHRGGLLSDTSGAAPTSRSPGFGQ